MSWSTPGIFNVLDPWNGTSGMIAGVGRTAAEAEANALILQQIIWYAQNANVSGCLSGPPLAATILFPGNSDVPPPVGAGASDNGQVYEIAVPSGIGATAAVSVGCNWPLRFLGTGNVKLSMVVNTVGDFGDMFSVVTNVGDNTGGITFEDLYFAYPTIDESEGIPEYAAIHVPGTGQANNVRIVRCAFLDWPIGIWLEDVLQCSVLQCTITYANNAGIGIWLGNGTNEGDKGLAKQVYVAGCVISTFSGHEAPSGGTGILIMGADQVRIVESDIGGFSTGIAIKPGPYGQNAVHLSFSNLGIYAGHAADSTLNGTAVFIQPQSTTVVIGTVTFMNCRFNAGENDTVGTLGAGVTVDNNSSIIDTVRFVSCISTRWSGPGLWVKFTSTGKLQNVEVLGGMYAGNNLGEVGNQPYGILLTGAVSGVRIVGASCVGQYRDITNSGSSDSPQQAVGIYVDAGTEKVVISGCDVRENAEYGIVVNAASDVVVSGCDLSGNGVGGSGAGLQVNNGASNVVIDGCDVTSNGTNGIQVNGTSGAVTGVFIRNCVATGYSGFSTAISVTPFSSNVSTVEITNCPGYNGVSTVALTTTLPGNGTPFHGYDHGYYGPVSFFVGTNTEVTAIEINGITTGLKTGSFVLYPQQSGVITYTGGGIAPTFVMIGQ